MKADYRLKTQLRRFFPLPKTRGMNPGPRKPSTSGVALVIVLGMLVLVVVLVIAFISSVSVELQSSKSYANESEARSLADSAVNIVISQIQDATTKPGLAWASQPGMIRTYDNKGNAATAYKLYSSGQLQLSGTVSPATLSAEVPGTWASEPNQYTDLNKPVSVSGTNYFPIIDPGAVAKTRTDTLSLADTTPIEGCFFTPTASVAVSGTSLPMPVQWLYVLKDGTVTTLDTATKTIPGNAATLSNPIVGRVAFWTDDESCKVNVNTASEGVFWDRPWADGETDGIEKTFASNMPVLNEFQRFPGHPAMTSLSPIFPPLPGESTVDYNNRIADIIPRVTYKDTTGAYGGSQSGTKAVTGTTKPLVPDMDRLFASVDEFLFSVTAGSTRQANLKGPGAAFTQQDIEKTRFFLTTSSRAPEVNLFNKPRITLWPLQANTGDISDPANAADRNAHDKLIAFCSTIGSGTDAKPYYFQRYNTFDQSKIRAAGAAYNPSQNPIPSSQSPTMDWDNVPRNQELYSYLRMLTSAPIPGLGGSLSGVSGKYNASTRDQILTEIMDYIRSSVNTFSTKEAPSYTYAPFPKNSSGWVTGEGQVVPLVIKPQGASYTTKGFGRFSTVTQAALIFYRTDKLTYVPNPAKADSDPLQLPDTSTTIDGKITVLDITPGAPLTIPPFPPFTPPAGSPLNKAIPIPTMRAVLILQTFNPTPGLPPWSGNVRYSIEGMDGLSVITSGTTSTSLGFPSPATNLVNAQEGYYDATALTGLEVCTQYWGGGAKNLGPTVVGAADEEKHYPFFSDQITLEKGQFDFSGGTIKVKIYSGYSNPNTSLNASDLVQTITMNFPPVSGLPIPTIPYTTKFIPADPGDPASKDKTTLSSNNSYADYDVRLSHLGTPIKGGRGVSDGSGHNPLPYIVGPVSFRGDTVRSVQARYRGPGLGDYRMIAGLANVPESYFEGHGMIDASTDGLKYSDTSLQSKLMHSLRVYVSVGNEQTGKSNGFYANANNTTGLTFPRNPGPAGHAKLVKNVEYLDPIASGGARPARPPVAPQGLNGAYMDAAGILLGDWDTGPGTQIDGPYINKADEGNSNISYFNTGANTTAGTIVETGASYSPNRQISSAVTFGSLPTGIDPANPENGEPWRTLLFCKNPAAGSDHPGFGTPKNGTNPPYTTPPDHAFLDFFTMPIVEPYAISEPFSTAGKVNMNYQIVPFTYLTRDTAVRAVLKSTNIMAIPTTSGRNYKSGTKVDFALTPPPDFRYTLNLDEETGTLAGFEQRFATGDIFRSASEICDLYLVPKYLVNTTTAAPGNPTYATMESWWTDYRLTGDNVRESPYGHIYPRLTTKSNTFTVHVIAQSLKKSSKTAPDQFVEGRDQVTGEFRGSFGVQRYLDPNSDTLVHADGKTPATELDEDAMVGPYKFRVISSKRFAP